MPTIEITFPGGRYHATPWGHHVNEGQIEWPPSPWRLLRTFVSVGFTTQHWTAIPDDARRLLECLAAVQPVYELPPASAAHSRHYMPTGELSKGVEKTTLVFDTWANIGDGALRVRWDCALDEATQALFARLVEAVGYLGRSESWIDARVIADDVEFNKDRLAYPHTDGILPERHWEQFVLTSPVPPSTYHEWRQPRVAQALQEHPLPDGKKKPTKALQKKRDAAVAPYPVDLLDCLQKDTDWWKKQHSWSQPPGSQRVLYWRRSDALVVSPPRRRSRQSARPVQAMLLAIATPSRNKSALPLVSRTLPQAELLHRALVSHVGKGHKVDCPELTGKDEHNRPLQQGHQHAHILPLDLDGDQHLDHFLIYAHMQLGSAAQHAIRSVKRTWTKGGHDDGLQLVVVGRGNLDDLRSLDAPLSAAIHNLMSNPAGSCIWTSRTPFVPPRHLKPNGKNSLVGQVTAELTSRGLPEPRLVEPMFPTDDVRRLRHYVRVRNTGLSAKHKSGPKPPPVDTGFALRLEFAEPVRGPVSLGYAAHFGLGQFAAIDV